MAEREVTMKLNLPGAEKAAAAMGDLAKNTKAAADAAGSAKAKFDAQAAALKQMEAEAQKAATRSARLSIDSGFAQSERERVQDALRQQQQREQQQRRQERQQLVASRARVAGVAAFASALGGGALQGASQGLGQIEAADSYGKALANVSSQFAEGIPLIGQAVTGLKSFVGAIEGTATAVKGQIEGLSKLLPERALQSQIRGLQAGGREEIFQAERQRREAGINRSAADRALQGLTRERLASFRPEIAPGVADASTGELRFQEYLARTGVGAAKDAVRGRQTDVLAAQAAAEQANARLAEAQRASDAARGQSRDAERAKVEAGAFAGVSGLGDQAKVGVEEKLGNALGGVANLADAAKKASDDAVAANERLILRQKDLEQAKLSLAQRELELGQKQADIARNRLALLDQEIAKSKEGAIGFGLAGPGSADAILALFRQARDKGLDTLPPEARQQLASNPITADFARKQGETLAGRDPAVQALLRETGRGDLASQEGRRNELVDSLNRLSAENQSKLAAAVEKALDDSLKGLTTAIVDKINAAIAGATAQLRGQQATQQLQRSDAGG